MDTGTDHLVSVTLQCGADNPIAIVAKPQPHVAVQHGHAADGALRPQDRRFFEAGIGPSVLPIYACAAADAQPVRRPGSVVGIPFLM